jgi:hypothetical protein
MPAGELWWRHQKHGRHRAMAGSFACAEGCKDRFGLMRMDDALQK